MLEQLILEIVIGGLCGFAANKIMKGKSNGILMNVILGVVGGLVGGFLGNLLGIGGGWVTGILLSIGGWNGSGYLSEMALTEAGRASFIESGPHAELSPPPQNILILNTRSSQALTQANIPRNQWKAIDRTGDPLFEDLLDGQLSRNKLTNEGIATVRKSGGK